VTVLSEKRSGWRMLNPWKTRPVRITRTRDNRQIDPRWESDVLMFPAEAGETYRIERA